MEPPSPSRPGDGLDACCRDDRETAVPGRRALRNIPWPVRRPPGYPDAAQSRSFRRATSRVDSQGVVMTSYPLGGYSRRRSGHDGRANQPAQEAIEVFTITSKIRTLVALAAVGGVLAFTGVASATAVVIRHGCADRQCPAHCRREVPRPEQVGLRKSTRPRGLRTVGDRGQQHQPGSGGLGRRKHGEPSG